MKPNPHDQPPADPQADPERHAHPRGYCPTTRALADWVDEGFTCPWEHCIETQPLSGGAAACPIFGHDCPNGDAQASECDEECVTAQAYFEVAHGKGAALGALKNERMRAVWAMHRAAGFTCPDFPPEDLVGARFTKAQARDMFTALRLKGREPAWFLGRLAAKGIGDGTHITSLPRDQFDPLLRIILAFPDPPTCPGYPGTDS